MKTVILLVTLALGGQSYPYVQDDDVTSTSNLEQTLKVGIQQDSLVTIELPPSPPSYVDPSILATETTTDAPSTDYVPSTWQTPPPPSKGRGSARFTANQQHKESDIVYLRKSTPSYQTDKVPTPKFHPEPPNTIHEQTNPHSSKLENEETIPKRRGGRYNPDADAYIVRYSNENNVRKGYKFGYETSNHMMRNEELVFDNPDNADEPTIYGGYEFTDPTGGRVVVTYTAGIFGFKPVIKYIKP